MDIVYTFDNGYFEIAAVSIQSLLNSNADCVELSIHIVDCGIAEENKKKLFELVHKHGRKIDFTDAIDIKTKIPVGLEAGYWSNVCYVRLFFADMFPSLDRIMHIDCDTLIRGSIESVFNIDLDTCVMASCYDCVPGPKRSACLPQEQGYYSNGVIVFDLKKIRERNIEEEFVNYIIKKNGVLPHLDQDVLSAVLSFDTRLLPPEFNVMSTTLALGDSCCDVFRSNEPYYSKEEMIHALANPVVIHFVGYRFFSRPWAQPCYHPYNSEWVDVYKNLALCSDEFTLLKKKKSKYGLMQDLILKLWNKGSTIPFIKQFLTQIEVSRFKK